MSLLSLAAPCLNATRPFGCQRRSVRRSIAGCADTGTPARPCVELAGLTAQESAYWFGHQLQKLAVEGRDHPIDGNRFAGLLESNDLRATHASPTALQLNEPKVQSIRVLLADAEYDRVDNARTGEPVAPSKNATRHLCSLQYVRKASLLAASAARAFRKALLIRRFLQCFCGGGALFTLKGGFLTWGEIGGHQSSISGWLCKSCPNGQVGSGPDPFRALQGDSKNGLDSAQHPDRSQEYQKYEERNHFQESGASDPGLAKAPKVNSNHDELLFQSRPSDRSLATNSVVINIAFPYT